MIPFKAYIVLNESLGKFLFLQFKTVFEYFHPTFSRNGKTINFKGINRTDIDGLIITLQRFFSEEGVKLKNDFGHLADYKLPDDTFVSIKTPKPNGRRFDIEVEIV